MDSKINLEELILTQLDRSLEMKNRLETKAIGYITAIALILTILENFIEAVYELKLHLLLKWGFLSFYILVFLLGLVLLFLCTKMLLPKKISYFDANKLLDFYNKLSEKKEINSDEVILSENKKYIAINTTTIEILDSYNKKVSHGLLFLVFGMFVSSISFFILLGVAK